jgi:dipeptidyl aminopeptidase/acylaminoacyl peptidase
MVATRLTTHLAATLAAFLSLAHPPSSAVGGSAAVHASARLAAATAPALTSQVPLARAHIEPAGDRLDFAQAQRQQADTDRAWRTASDGFMRMEKITYRSGADDLDVPAFVFQPLETGAKRGPALVWVHENIRGHLYEHYIPYIREATARGYVVIAPEYRGSIGYGRQLYEAIDYGGAEVDDVAAAASALSERYPTVDPARIGIIGWSHGGLITLLSIFRNPTTFSASVAIVPVTNLFHRLARKGVERQRRLMDPYNRFGGPPSERPEVYRYRSPLFHVDRLQIPLLVHVAENDEDVNIDEAMQLVDALRARKPALAEIKVYSSPPGGHTFDRRVRPRTWQPENTPDQRDSWERVWKFLDSKLQAPYN